MFPWCDELTGAGRYPHDRPLHPPRDGPGLERPAQVRALVPGGDPRPGGARRRRPGARRGRRAGAQRGAADPRARGGDRGDDAARRHRLPHRVGGQHDAALGRRVRAPRDDVVRPARHRARGAADRGDRSPAGQGRPAGRRPAGPRARAPVHDQGGAHPRGARGARRVGPPGRRHRLRDGPLAGPAARRAGAGRGGRHLRRGRHVLADRPVGGGRRRRRAGPAAGRRIHPGGAARLDQRVGRGAGGHRHGLRDGRPRGAARAADRGAGAVRGVRLGPEGLQRDAAQEEPDPLRAHRRPGPRRAGGDRAGDGRHPAVARAGHLALLDRAGLPARRGDHHRLPAAPDHGSGGEPGRRRRPDAGQPGVHRWADLHLLGAAGAGRGRPVPRGRLRAGAVGGDGDVEHRDAVPRDAACPRQGGRRGARRGAAGRDLPAGAVRTEPRPAVRARRGPAVSVELPLLARGKVREIYDAGDDRLLLVASDRISAYDHVLPTPIPDKGRVLTQLSVWWFEQLTPVLESFGASHHLVSADDVPAEVAGRAMLVRRLDMVPVECVARGYLSGSGTVEYQRTGSIRDVALPSGLVEGSRLPEPVFTPSTKAEVGQHDEAIDFSAVVSAVGADRAEELRALTLALYSRAAEIAEAAGIILADTKFEFGLHGDALVLADEVLTPDSSRFWPASSWAPGAAQPSYDKQYVRDWLTHESGWDRVSPPPELPDDVVAATRERYVTAYEQLTGRRFT